MVPEFYSEVIARRNKNLTITDIGKDYGLSVHQMTNLLKLVEIIKNNNSLFDKYHLTNTAWGYYYGFDIGSKQYVMETSGRLAKYTIKFNNKGLEEIYNRLKDLDIRPICEALFYRSSDITPKTLYCLYKRPGDIIYIGYTKNRRSDDKISLVFQPIDVFTANKIRRMMVGSKKWEEDINSHNRFIGPRIDSRDKNYYVIDKFMHDRYLKALDINKEVQNIKNLNNQLYKTYMEVV